MREATMYKTVISFLMILLFSASGYSAQAVETDLGSAEFKQLYDSLLAGKTLVNEYEKDGFTIRTERQFGQAIDLAEDDYEIPVTRTITKFRDGQVVQKITVNILDRVHDIGDSALIYEEARKMTVENPDAAPLDTNQSEYFGLYRVSKNDKGGFDVHNFGLIPSVVVEDGKNSLAASNISYSCYPENNLSTCVLTIRDYTLEGYEPLTGYKLGEPIGGDYVEKAVEVGQ